MSVHDCTLLGFVQSHSLLGSAGGIQATINVKPRRQIE